MTVVSHASSAAPRREQGLRSRAGNAMARTRTAVIAGAQAAVAEHGARRTTMADLAGYAGIAKGTLYNHFRTKEAVFAAAVESVVRATAADAAAAADADLAAGLALAAERIGGNPAVRRIAADEPAVLAALTTPTDGPLWALARSGVRDVLRAAGARAGAAEVDLVLRWLTSAVASPVVDPERQAGLLAVGLRPPPLVVPDAVLPPAVVVVPEVVLPDVAAPGFGRSGVGPA